MAHVDPVRCRRRCRGPCATTPPGLGLTLDAEGWAPVEELLRGLRRSWSHVTRAEVENVVRQDSRQRYELADGRIRARYGHSLLDRVELPVADPPDVLFHGTGLLTAAAVAAEGLRPMGRQFVHLSPAEETARVVGARHGRPVVFVVDARAAAAGVVFRRGNDDTWPADEVGPSFLTRR